MSNKHDSLPCYTPLKASFPDRPLVFADMCLVKVLHRTTQVYDYITQCVHLKGRLKFPSWPLCLKKSIDVRPIVAGMSIETYANSSGKQCGSQYRPSQNAYPM